MTVAIQAPTGERDTNSDSDGTTHASGPIQLRAQGKKVAGINTIASQMEGGDLGQHRRLPRWSCDRDNAERWFV